METVWAQPEAVRDAWLLDADLPDDNTLTALLGRAQRHLEGLDRSLAGRVAVDSALAAAAADVLVDMVIRLLRNPEGTRTVSETTGPISTNVTYGGDEPGSLYVTDEERELLRIRSHRRQRAFSVSMRPPRRGRP